jgi:membrane associated rhomboid family serine protease
MLPIRDGVAIRYPPVVTWSLIFVNCSVFLYQVSLGPAELEQFLFSFGLMPARYFDSVPSLVQPAGLVDYLPFVTNTFLHGGWLHLILNMWTLWIFGPAVEDRLGAGRFLLFYVVAGIAASFTHAVFNPDSMMPALGASGAIAGVIGCYVWLFPFARLIVLVPILFFPLFFQIPAVIFAGFWFLMQVLQGSAQVLAPLEGGGVAWWAHIGGFVFGLILGPLLSRSPRIHRPYYADEGVHGFTPTGRP